MKTQSSELSVMIVRNTDSHSCNSLQKLERVMHKFVLKNSQFSRNVTSCLLSALGRHKVARQRKYVEVGCQRKRKIDECLKVKTVLTYTDSQLRFGKA